MSVWRVYAVGLGLLAIFIGWWGSLTRTKLMRLFVCSGVEPLPPVFAPGKCSKGNATSVRNMFCDAFYSDASKLGDALNRDTFAVLQNFITREEVDTLVKMYESSFTTGDPIYSWFRPPDRRYNDNFRLNQLPETLLAKVQTLYSELGKQLGQQFVLTPLASFVSVGPGDNYSSKFDSNAGKFVWHQDGEYLAEGLLTFRLTVVKESLEDANVAYIPSRALKACAPQFGKSVDQKCCGQFFHRSFKPQKFDQFPSADTYWIHELQRTPKLFSDQVFEQIECVPATDVGDAMVVRKDAVHKTAPVNSRRLTFQLFGAHRHFMIKKSAILTGTLSKWHWIRGHDYSPMAEVLGLMSAFGVDEISYGEYAETYAHCFLWEFTPDRPWLPPKDCPLSRTHWFYMQLSSSLWRLYFDFLIWSIEFEFRVC